MNVLVVMKHHYGQLGFPEIVSVESGCIDCLIVEQDRYNNPPLCNEGYKAVIKEVD